MVARDGKHRYPHGADGAARGGYQRLGGAGRIKEIAGHHHELRLMLTGFGRNPLEDDHALVPKQCTFLVILNPGEGFAELPIRRVNEASAHTWPSLGAVAYRELLQESAASPKFSMR
jgi:hypothetical protein